MERSDLILGAIRRFLKNEAKLRQLARISFKIVYPFHMEVKIR